MSESFYSASLSRTQGRNIWAVIFRHPKRTGPTTGKEGLRARQSLKTDKVAGVTFFPMEDVREHLKECVSAAVLAAYRSESDSDQMRRLLTHVNQRFRFNYVLGNGPVKDTSGFDDDGNGDIDAESGDLLKRTNDVLSSALASVKEIAAHYGKSLRTELNATDEKDQRVIDELFEEDLDNRTRDDEAFQQVVDAIMDEIEERFASAFLPDGKLQKTKVGWPLTWTWETGDRDAFIASISRFASNYAPLFGTLLTPLVNGVRVSGPFYPAWPNDKPKLVLLDGEGLEHSRSVSPISTSQSKRIDMVDAVILVDNAMQPMLSAPVAAMKELVSSGNSAKLIFAFTHFDKVSGDNLPNPSARAQHVLASAENVLSAIGEDLGPFAERALRARLKTSRVFLADLDQKLDVESKDGKRTASQLGKLLEMIDSIVERPKPIDSRPIYDRMNLVLPVRDAAVAFNTGWRRRLEGIDKEPWQRVKTLSRRFATGVADHYDTLHPVADLKRELQQRLYVLLQNPVAWNGP